MKMGQDYFPKSSFLSIDKDLNLIIQKILTNQNLLKLLYYPQKDCLSAKNLTAEQIQSMINNQILIVPRILIDEQCPTKLIINFNNFSRNIANPQFRNNNLDFIILCHPDHCNLGNFALRPYKIAGELDAMFDNQKLTGIGTTQFSFCDNISLNEQYMGLLLEYSIIHGSDDKISPLM